METDVFAFKEFNKGPGTSTRSEAALGQIRPWPGTSTRSEAGLGAQPGPVAKKFVAENFGCKIQMFPSQNIFGVK